LDIADKISETIRDIGITTIVSCPLAPLTIPGVSAAAYTAGDCIGTVAKLAVPKRGLIVSATLWDLSDQGGQIDLEIFKNSITEIGDNGVWAPTDQDILSFVIELAFVSFDDHGGNQTSEVNSISKAYTSPEGFFYIQAVDRGAKTIAAVQIPHFQLQILSSDPDFVER